MAAVQDAKAFGKFVDYHRREGWVFGTMKCMDCEETSFTLERPLEMEGAMDGEVTSNGPLNPCPHCGSVCNWEIICHLPKRP